MALQLRRKTHESIDTWDEHGYEWSLIIFGVFSIIQGFSCTPSWGLLLR